MSSGSTAAGSAATAPVTHTLGVPRIGPRRELKRALESAWRGESTEGDLAATGQRLRLEGWRRQREAGIDLVACNDFSLYDHVLDTACLVGCVPARFDFAEARISTATMFAMARGGPRGGRALEMTKWFDTNYHHLVPEVDHLRPFRVASDKPFEELAEARAAGLAAKPVLLGPVTFLRLAKAAAEAPAGFSPLARLDALLGVYGEVLRRLDRQGAEWVQLDEPVLALDLPGEVQAAIVRAYETLRAAAPRLRLLVATYFGPLGANLETFLRLPVAGLHVDGVRGRGELPRLLERFPRGRTLSLGIVDGRNVWRTDLASAWGLLELARASVGTAQLMVAPSCSLLHVPWTLRSETALPEAVHRRLAFAEEKLGEVATLARALRGEPVQAAIAASRPAAPAKGEDEAGAGFRAGEVERLVGLAAAGDGSGALARRLGYPARRRLQRERWNLPAWPTTTIGSLPQTDAIRQARARWRAGELPDGAYEAVLEQEIAAGIARQQAAGLDVLVHGEFERTDMVEHFGEQLEGFATTQHGWVQSYGSRYVRPPILHGPVHRRGPLTIACGAAELASTPSRQTGPGTPVVRREASRGVRDPLRVPNTIVPWARFAQSLTSRPVKGMLTGPATLLKWSFVREDQPAALTCAEIAAAVREEAVDLERAGIGIIQIDEPALREGLPLRAADRAAYLAWAVACFRLAAGGVSPAAQIHTHMCYAEFADILPAVIALDADVLTIEATRSGEGAIAPFAAAAYPNEIGPGVWDIHSPQVPTAAEITARLDRARAAGLPADRLWVNPDCGLKTRTWQEVDPSLRNLVEAARTLRTRG
jgi:5-methyltetrahydropteroyltriglutamate--homocysteine methyltransferase